MLSIQSRNAEIVVSRISNASSEKKISSGRFIIAVRKKKGKKKPVLFWRLFGEPGDAKRERQTTTEAKRDARTSFRTGYRFRHGGTNLGNDERPCVPHEDKSSRTPAVFVGRYLFRQRIIVVYYLKFGTFNSPLVFKRGCGSGSNTGETILEWKNPSATSAEKG